MRLIDADECEKYFYNHMTDAAMTGAMNAIDEMPTIEPCEDCVSRDAVHSMLENVPIGPNDKWFNWLQKACLRLAELPTVDPKQKWIPVNYDKYPETYPKAFQEVWVTDANDQVHHIAYNGTRNIKAWMPYVRPEPYKEGDKE